MERIEYDDDGKGIFYLIHRDGKTSETKINLSFYGVHAYSESIRKNGQTVEFIRVKGLAKRLADQEFRERITEINGSSRV